MIRFRLSSRSIRRNAVLPLLALACLSAAACDRALLDPALRNGDEAALLRAAGLARPESRYTLPGMVLEATRTLGRADQADAARELLEGLRREQVAAVAAAQGADSGSAAAAQERLRQAELAMVAAVMGKSGAERAVAGVAERLGQAASALDSAAARERDVVSLRAEQEAVAASLQAARASLELGQTVAALDLCTRAADQLIGLRRGILDLDRVRALPDLYVRAERLLANADGEFPGGAELLRDHAALKAAASVAVASGDRDRAHRALTAVRESELRITLEALGPATAATVVADVGKALRELKSAAPAAEPRVRRMLRAASDLHYRASSALGAGDGIAALDLASYAAGLVNAFRLATVRY